MERIICLDVDGGAEDKFACKEGEYHNTCCQHCNDKCENECDFSNDSGCSAKGLEVDGVVVEK